MKHITYWCSALAGAFFILPAFAQDHADIDKSQISGNRELPKLLYIVPWKKPIPGDLSGKPLQSVIDEALAPVDKDVFQREVKYDGKYQAKNDAKAEPASTDKKSATTINTNSNTKQP